MTLTPNKRLREERRRRGWTQVDVVKRMYQAATDHRLPIPEGLDNTYISKYERGQNRPSPHHVHLLCLAFDLPSDRLGLPGNAGPPSIPVGPGSSVPAPVRFDLPAVPASADATAELIDSGRLTFALAHPGLIDKAVIDDLVTMTRLYARHAQVLAPKVLGSAVLDLMRRLYRLLDASHSDSIRRRLQSLYAENATMAGRLAFWSDDRGQAEELLRMAGKLAVETNERHLQAVVLSFRADLYSTVPYIGTVPNNTNVALALFEEAATLDAPDTPPLLRSWVFGCRAEEYATLKRALESDRDMERAYTAQARIAQPGLGADQVLDISTLDIAAAAAGLSGFEGACALALGRAREAREAFTAGLKEQSSIGRISGLAAAYALEGDIESAADLLIQGLEEAIRRQLPTRRRRVEGVRAAFLSRAQDHPAVRRFDERLRAAIG